MPKESVEAERRAARKAPPPYATLTPARAAPRAAAHAPHRCFHVAMPPRHADHAVTP